MVKFGTVYRVVEMRKEKGACTILLIFMYIRYCVQLPTKCATMGPNKGMGSQSAHS